MLFEARCLGILMMDMHEIKQILITVKKLSYRAIIFFLVKIFFVICLKDNFETKRKRNIQIYAFYYCTTFMIFRTKNFTTNYLLIFLESPLPSQADKILN